MIFYVSYSEAMEWPSPVEADTAEQAADMAANGGVHGITRAEDGDDLYVRRTGDDRINRFSCESVRRIDVHWEPTP